MDNMGNHVPESGEEKERFPVLSFVSPVIAWVFPRGEDTTTVIHLPPCPQAGVEAFRAALGAILPKN